MSSKENVNMSVTDSLNEIHPTFSNDISQEKILRMQLKNQNEMIIDEDKENLASLKENISKPSTKSLSKYKNAVRKEKQLNDSQSTMQSINTQNSLMLSESIERNFFELNFCSNEENVSYSGEYINEIYQTLLGEERENTKHEIFGYMEKQPEINEQMRTILIDWLIELHYKFKLKTASLFLTVYIIDKFLSMKLVSRNKLQLLGIAALFIACKQEESKFPTVNDLIYVTDNAYQREELIMMEKIILVKLGYNLVVPSAIHFYEILAKAFGFNRKQFYFGNFFMESFLLSYNSTKYSPSIIACSCAYIVMKFFRMKNYQLCYDKRFNSEEASQSVIKSTSREICNFIEKLINSEWLSTKNKFASDEYEKVFYCICS